MPSVPTPCPLPSHAPVTCFTDAVGTRYLSAEVTITKVCPYSSPSLPITLVMPVGAYVSYTSQAEADDEALVAGTILADALRAKYPCAADQDLLLLEDNTFFLLASQQTLSLS